MFGSLVPLHFVGGSEGEQVDIWYLVVWLLFLTPWMLRCLFSEMSVGILYLIFGNRVSWRLDTFRCLICFSLCRLGWCLNRSRIEPSCTYFPIWMSWGICRFDRCWFQIWYRMWWRREFWIVVLDFAGGLLFFSFVERRFFLVWFKCPLEVAMDFGRCLLMRSLVRPDHVSKKPYLIADSHVDVTGLNIVTWRKAAWSLLLYGS